MSVARVILLTLALCLAAAAAGVVGGAAYVSTRLQPAPSLHDTLHRKLHLSAEQDRRIEGLERDHAARRKALEAEMRAANAELAQAYQESHAFTPKAQAAIDRFHHAMDALQAETLQHVIAMRSVLTPGQAAQFDDTVVKSLTDGQ